MKKKIIISVIYFTFMIFKIFAIQIDIETAQKMAEKNNFDIQKSELDYKNSELVKKEAIKYILPTLSWTGMAAKTDKNMTSTVLGANVTTFGPIVVRPIDKIEINDTNRMFSNSLAITQPIYYAGREWAGIRIADISNKMSKVNLKQKKNDVKISIIEDYISVLKTKKSKEILEKSLNEMNSIYQKMEEMYNLKMITKTSLLDMKSRIFEIESNLISIDMALELAEMNLKSKIGIPLSEKLELKDVNVNLSSYSAINIDKDIEKYINKKTIFKVLEYSKMLKENDKRLVLANILPQIGFRFEYSMKGNELKHSIDSDYSSWNAGISINMNLWDWGITFDKMAEKDNEMKKINIDIKNTKNSMEMLARKYYFDIERLKKLIEAKNEAFTSAKEMYDIEKEKLDLKMSTATDFLSAENLLRKSETELITAKLDFYLAVEKYYNFMEKEDKTSEIE